MEKRGKVESREFRSKIPKVLLKEFKNEVRFVLKEETAGLWPIPIDALRKANFVKELIADKEFANNYEIVAIPRR